MARIPRPTNPGSHLAPVPSPPPEPRHVVMDEALSRELAVRAQVDPRSIRREYAQPGSVRGMSGRRAREVLVEAGYLPPERTG